MPIAYPTLASPSERNSVPAPETDRIVALTPKGEATRHAYKLAHALRALDDEARDDVLGVLYLELADPQTA
jgi:hypothetical protein